MNVNKYLNPVRSYHLSPPLLLEDEIVKAGWEIYSNLNHPQEGPPFNIWKQARLLLANGDYENSLRLYLNECTRYENDGSKIWNDFWIRPNTILNVKFIIGGNQDIEALEILHYVREYTTSWVDDKLIDLVKFCDFVLDGIRARFPTTILESIAVSNVQQFQGEDQSGDSIFSAIWPFLYYLPEKERENNPLYSFKGFNVLKARLAPPFEEKNFNQFIKNLARESENLVRDHHSVPRVGEGWISETELYKTIKDRFRTKYKVLQHGSPDWLGRQHFDVWIPELSIAIEYQGQQHYEPIDHFGGEEGFKKTVQRDNRKRKLAKAHNVLLIEVDSETNIEDIFSTIENVVN